MSLSAWFLLSGLAAADPAIHVDRQGREIVAPERIRQGLPSLKERAIVFSSAGLETDVEKMDEYARDKLYINASALKTEPLKKLYPKIAAAKLEKLQKAIRSRSRGG